MANIIYSPDSRYNENALYYFKKEYTVTELQPSILNIFADSRYKLYVNGQLAAVGPCRASSDVRYYDAVDITKHLCIGANKIEIHVLQLACSLHEDSYIFLESVMRSGNLALCVWGNCGDSNVQTDTSWLVAKETGLTFFQDEKCPYYNVAVLSERISKNYRSDLCFTPAVEGRSIYCYDEAVGSFPVLTYPVKKSPIPMMFFSPATLNEIRPGVYDAGALTCGYIRLRCSGKGHLHITYAESMSFIEDGQIVKRKRNDENGLILGDSDEIAIDGVCTFEPYWMRTFRYIEVKAEGDVRIDRFDYLETGYPLVVADGYDFGNEKDNKLFEISVNTLRRCMHETYTDCPYYEQLQYTMDTYSQILFTYQLTTDRALAEKAIDDFAASYRVGGLTQSRFPVISAQYIPGFSLFFVLMVYEHAQRFGDLTFLRKYLHIADGVVDWFVQRLQNYMVPRSALWDFVDWSEEYDNGCIPSKEPIAVYSLMLAYTLEKLSYLHRLLGNTADPYNELAAKIKAAVKTLCYDEDCGFYADAPDKAHFSQHPQIWAVLCGMEVGQAAKELLIRSNTLKNAITSAYMYLYLRALEIAGIYDESEAMMNKLRRLVDLGCTTTPETLFEANRSECHAWSAVAIYEFTAKVLGVTYCDGQIRIAPYIKGRSYAKGTVATPVGMVHCQWKESDDQFTLSISLPKGETAVLILPNGETIHAESGTYTAKLS